ncbi:MAG: AsnC family transcriptional regulator [Bacillota bacterium]
MDEIDLEIINIIQEGIPLEARPFQKIGEKLGIKEKEVTERLKKLKNEGLIRRIGGVFDSSSLGYCSTLIGLKIEEDKFYKIVEFINKHPGVTHNYRRDGYLNLWFTLSTIREIDKQLFLDKIKNREGVKLLYELPKKKLFKLKVFFEMGNKNGR